MLSRNRALGSRLEHYPYLNHIHPRDLNSSFNSKLDTRGITPTEKMQQQQTLVLSSQQATSVGDSAWGFAQKPTLPASAFADNYSRRMDRDFTWSNNYGIVFAAPNSAGKFLSRQRSYELGVRRNNSSRRAWAPTFNHQSLGRLSRGTSPLRTVPEKVFQRPLGRNFHAASIRFGDAETTITVDPAKLPESLIHGFDKPYLQKSNSEGNIGFRARTENTPRDAADMNRCLFLDTDVNRETNTDSDPEYVDNEYPEASDSEGTSEAASNETEAPHIPLSYQIPERVKRQAMRTSTTSAAAYWSYNMYQSPNGEKVKVHYCKSKGTTERVAQYFLDKDVVGFDIEWKPQAKELDGAKNNVSLIQLACEDRIALFHIAQYSKHNTLEDLVSPTLKMIMESPSIVKVGVAIKADCTRLKKFLNIDSRGIFELSHLHTQVSVALTGEGKLHKKLVALAKQVEEHLQLPMFKGEVRSSDWSKELKIDQIIYAASDTYAGLRLYDALEAKRKLLDPRPPRPYFAELDLPIALPGGYKVQIADEPVENEGVEARESTLEDGVGQPSDMPQNKGVKVAPERDEDLKAEKTLKHPQAVAAELWMNQFCDCLPAQRKPRVGKSHLRSYMLWHNSSLGVEDIARMLRDPPLQTNTVATYILESVRLEKLPYDRKRIADVLKHLPPSLTKARYRKIDAE